MIIGVDAGALSITDERLKVGVYRVTLNLLRELGRLDQKNEYRLYSFRPLEQALMRSFGPRMTNHVLRPLPGWFTLRLPIELRIHPVDIFLGLSQAIPFSAPKKSFGFVYDLGFLHYPEAYPGSLRQLVKHTEELVDRASHVVAISRSTAEDLVQKYHYPRQKITVASPGVDMRFKPTGPKFKSEHPYFLFVGALKRGKNLPTAARAFADFLKRSQEIYDFLIIGGNFWEDREIKKTIKSLNLGSRVKLLGFVPDQDLPKYYRGALALVNPSLWEGFCLPAVEAMVSGTPVIGSTHGSLPEIVDGAGILVSPSDVHGLSQAMMVMAEDMSARKKFRSTCLVQAKKFSWETMAKTVLTLLV